MKRTALLLSLILIFLLAGCNEQITDDRITVAVSIEPQKTFVEKVCGDKVRVITMIPAGASAESYEMSPKEITSFSESDIYFSIGVPAEENGILPHISKSTKTVELAPYVAEKYPDIKIGDERDPHIWLSPKRVAVMIEKIALEMSDIDPENAKLYQENSNRYIKELLNADKQITQLFKDKMKKVFYISHPSYGYFAADYGLEMISLEENGAEVTPNRLAEITDSAKESGVKTVFYQEETSKKQAELLAKELGGDVIMLSPLSPDYSENILETANLIYEAIYGKSY